MRALQDPRKGYPELIAAIRRLKESARAADLMLVVFGDPNVGDLPDLEIASRNVGYVGDDQQLSRLIRPRTSRSCPPSRRLSARQSSKRWRGTPVVAFDTGGPRDIITHLHDGFLAQPQSTDDLARGIAWAWTR